MSERKQIDTPSERQARLRAALRENLKRRKAQARGRADTPKPSDSELGNKAMAGKGPARS